MRPRLPSTATARLATAAALAGAALMTGCGGGGDTAGPNADSDSARNTHDIERNSYPFGLACGWQFASNIDTLNIAFPDESAKYWVALVPMLPETRLRIDGHYPDARYFSYNVYDPILRPSDAIADVEITPLAGGANPFSNTDAHWGDAYTSYVAFIGKPDLPAPNTIYAGEISLGSTTVPQPALTALMYRVYVPGEGKDFDGGVGLPLLTLESAAGDIELLPTADCVEPLLPTLGDTLPDLNINELLEGVDFPDNLLLQEPGAIPVGTPEAETNVFYGLPSTVFNLLSGFLGLPLPEGIDQQLPLPAGGGFLSNIHNAYTTNLFSRSYGNVVMIRARAPSHRNQPGMEPGQEQLRFWSVCQNDLVTQRYVACTADHEAAVDDEGFFTVMVSDPADRPANAIAENNINWLPWGPYVDALLIYRHMLPNPSFGEAIHNVPQGTPPREVMGDFVPEPAYCQPDIVEQAGNSAAQVFAACRAYTETLVNEGP